MENVKIVYKNIEDIIPYVNNPRDNKKAVDAVANSIKEFGFKVPVVLGKDGVIVTGHTRILASKKLGLKKIPCIIAEDLNEEQLKAFRLADNKVSEASKWKKDLLNIELQGIDMDMEQFGFDLDFGEEEIEEEPEMEFAEELLEEHNYVVLYFDNTLDWQVAVERLGIKMEVEKLGKTTRKGLGRVINGARALELLEGK